MHVRHAEVEVNLLLGKQALFDIAFDSAQQEGAQDLVKLLDDGVLVTVLAREPLVESLGITKNVGKEEVEKRPQLVEVVLQRCTGDEESVSGVEESDNLRERGFFVLDAVGLVTVSTYVPGHKERFLTSSIMMYSQANFLRCDFSRRTIS